MNLLCRAFLVLLAPIALFLSSVPPAAAQDAELLSQAIRNVITSLPMFGRSKEAQDGHPYTDARSGSYHAEGDAGMLGLPIAEPTKALYKVSWSVEQTSIRGTPEERRIAYDNWREPCGTGNVNPGTLGPDTCVGSNATAGTNDPTNFADPYMSSGTVAAVRGCATVWVQATLGAHPHASHGARKRPEVMQAMEAIARNLAQSAATEIIRAVDAACLEIIQRRPPPDGGGEQADRLEATVNCDSSTIVISQLPSLNCHIIFTSWIKNSSYPVEVTFPLAVDMFGNHANGIQIAQGPGLEYVTNWDITPHSWGMFVFACPALQNTGANCYSSVTTPGQVVSVPIRITQRDLVVDLTLTLNTAPHPNVDAGGSPYQVNLNQVFVNGYYFASAEVGLQVGWDRSAIASVINSLRQSAANSGVLPVEGFDRLAGLVYSNIANQQLAQEIAALKTQFAQVVSRQCHNNLNLYWIWAMGFYASSSEMGAQYGLDKGWLLSQLSELRNATASAALPIDGIDQALAYLNAGYSQQQTHPMIVAVKDQLAQGTNFVYPCQ